MNRLKYLTLSTLIVAVVLLLNFGAWSWLNRPVAERPWVGTINCVSFQPMQKDQSPLTGNYPTYAQMENDVRLLSRQADGLRTYTSMHGEDKIAEMAQQYGMKVIAGAWVENINHSTAPDPSVDNPADQAEVDAAVTTARRNPNVTHLMIGNEAVLRGEYTADQMAALLKRIRKETNVPVSTADIWSNWLAHPELVEASDYIAVHMLPYWEGVPVDKAVDYVMDKYDQIHAKYPDKPIMLAEVGWPSAGPWIKGAEPSLVNQARFIRDFLNAARARHITYTIMEGIDQPWKFALEGPAGTSWGLLTADRQEKYGMVGNVVENHAWPWLFGLASLLALPGILLLLRRGTDLAYGGRLFYAMLIQAVASILVWTVSEVATEAFQASVYIAWGLLMLTQLVLFTVILSDGFELTEVLWRNRWSRAIAPARHLSAADPDHAKKVSIHVPCYNEPPHMVIETLDRLAALDYPRFEVLLIDNNTKDPAVWEPVKAHCELLDARHGPGRFRFFHLDNWPGYKAGALNFGLRETSEDSEVVAVIDSDYLVDRDWLSAMTPFFDDPKIGLVQSPQDYHDWSSDTFKTMCQWEYAGFFNIGMVQRNERNAIIQHGTMTMIRKSALAEAGGWAEWCICEDAELGLKLFERGWLAAYSPESFGKGLVPDSFSAYKTQRHRWAYGAVQIVKKHWRSLLPGSQSLTRGQRYHFIAGWMPWFADAAHLLFAAASVFWSFLVISNWLAYLFNLSMFYVGDWLQAHDPAMRTWAEQTLGIPVDPKNNWHTQLKSPFKLGFPPTAFMIPTIAAFMLKVAGGFWLYQLKIKCTFWQKLGAAIAGMALTYTVGTAVWQGLFTQGRPFVRTPKCKDQPAFMQGILMAKSEIRWLAALWISATLVIMAESWHNREAVLWASLLVVQSLPFIAALITSMLNAMPGLLGPRARHGAPVAAE
jgi:cellulose synthase/poly-beta-1,6-N-acetylglucosamine synthase-like glycosyltransferase/exo-beta-1,3-glucanase (GH17 family)